MSKYAGTQTEKNLQAAICSKPSFLALDAKKVYLLRA